MKNHFWSQDKDDQVDGVIVEESHHSSVSSTRGKHNAAAAAAQQEAEEKQKILAQGERRAVNGLRIAVLLVLLTTTTLVSVGVFLYTSADQKQDFESEFYGFADRIMDSFHTTVEHKLGAIDYLASTITSFALHSGNAFPNVTLPDFEIRGANARVVADSTFFRWMPLVTKETRAGWEAYAAKNHMWMEKAYMSEMEQKARQDAFFNITKKQQQQPNNNHSDDKSRRRMTMDMAFAGDGEQDIWQKERQEQHKDNSERHLQQPQEYVPYVWKLPEGRNVSAPEDSGPFLMYWQTSPVFPVKSLLNFNLLSHPAIADGCFAAIKSGRGVLGKATNLNVRRVEGDTYDETEQYTQFNLLNGQYRDEVATFIGMPLSPLQYPVFDSFGPDRKVAGLVATNFYWYQYFVDQLPETASSIVATLENNFNQSFSFRVDGNGVEYLGPGDHHDPKFDYLKVSASVAEHVEKRARPATRAFTTVPLDQRFSTYILNLYPTQDLEDNYVNNEPMLFAILVASIFAFASLVFITYDCLAQRQHRIVMEKAVKSGVIVSSLFPEEVRDRLFDKEKEQKEELKTTSGNKRWHVNSAPGADALFGGDGKVQSDTPIADLYPECSVLFMDIAGFTAWSSGRLPCEVFSLLENIYGNFDAIALRRGVFKIETIGDCYLCVTGLPKAQPDHAVIMCKFASDCVRKMDTLMRDLSETLGEDTANLGMRVGIHSGPVTAGVLRGQKSRFQLFGDTVNTAARMESNGIKGRVQISESTANELTARGKSHWLIPREDRIQAKGKGELQTFWVHIEGRSTVRGTSHGGTSSAGHSSVNGGDLSGRPNDDDVVVICDADDQPEGTSQRESVQAEPRAEQNYHHHWRQKLKEQFSD